MIFIIIISLMMKEKRNELRWELELESNWERLRRQDSQSVKQTERDPNFNCKLYILFSLIIHLFNQQFIIYDFVDGFVWNQLFFWSQCFSSVVLASLLEWRICIVGWNSDAVSLLIIRGFESHNKRMFYPIYPSSCDLRTGRLLQWKVIDVMESKH